MGRKKDQQCTCGNAPIEEMFGTCIACFARDAAVYMVFVEIVCRHGMAVAEAAKPVLQKALETGWKEEYLEEFQVNLATQTARYGGECGS